METEKGIVINNMNGSISVRASWFDKGKSFPIAEKDIDECLPTVVKNLFKLRDGGKIEQSIFTR